MSIKASYSVAQKTGLHPDKDAMGLRSTLHTPDTSEVQHLSDDELQEMKEKYEHTIREQLQRIFKGNELETEAVVSRVLVVLWRKAKQFKGTARFTTWLHTVTYHEACAHLKFIQGHEKKVTTIDRVGEDHLSSQTIPDDMLWQRENHKAMLSFINGMKKPNRVLLKMFYFRDRTYQELSRKFHTPLGSIKRKLHEARSELKEVLHSAGIESQVDW